MKLYHAYVAGKSKYDRIDFFLVEDRPRELLREILHHFGLNKVREMLKTGELNRDEAEALCIIASKLLFADEVEALRAYIRRAMGLGDDKFFTEEIIPPMNKALLKNEALNLALKEYHQDGLFLALWANPHYDVPVKVGGFVFDQAQQALQKSAAKVDQQFKSFVNQANTLDDLLGPDHNE